jgi:hypothetical protein
MSAPENTASVYLYLLAPAGEDQVRALVDQLLGQNGWTFGGTLVWNAQGPSAQNLRPIEPLLIGAELKVRGDFGHAFNQETEVRWKRTGVASYDVLVLREQPLAPESLPQLRHALRADPAERVIALQSDEHPPLRGKYYYGRGNGVVLVRYTRLEEANQ